ncbi:MAG: glycosyl hydrolase 108 family protein, partial [Planctomycetota bacterium]
MALKHHPEAWGLVKDGTGWSDPFGNYFDDLDAANEGAVLKRPTREQATEIYAKQYWDPIYGDSLHRLDPGTAKIIFDGAVNHGVRGMT